jgi:hypothetical protein
VVGAVVLPTPPPTKRCGNDGGGSAAPCVEVPVVRGDHISFGFAEGIFSGTVTEAPWQKLWCKVTFDDGDRQCLRLSADRWRSSATEVQEGQWCFVLSTHSAQLCSPFWCRMGTAPPPVLAENAQCLCSSLAPLCPRCWVPIVTLCVVAPDGRNFWRNAPHYPAQHACNSPPDRWRDGPSVCDIIINAYRARFNAKCLPTAVFVAWHPS